MKCHIDLSVFLQKKERQFKQHILSDLDKKL